MGIEDSNSDIQTKREQPAPVGGAAESASRPAVTSEGGAALSPLALALRELQAQQEITDTVLAHLTQPDLLDAILASLMRVMHSDNAAILLLDHTQRALTLHTVLGPEEAVMGEVRVPVGDGVAGHIVASGAPLIVADLRTVPVVNRFLQEHLRSLVGVPLTVEGRTIGAVHVDSVMTNRFGPADARLLQLVADRIALALDRARLFEEVEQARAETAKRVSQLEATWASTSEGVVLYDTEAKVVYENAVMTRALGLHPSHAFWTLPLVERAADLDIRDERGEPIPPDELPPMRALRGDVFAGEQAMFVRIRGPRGDERCFQVSGAPVRDAQGSIVGASSVWRDVTLERQRQDERARLLQALRASEARYRATFEQAAVGMAMVGPNGEWLDVNQRLCEIMGYSRGELLARTFQDSTYPADLEADLALLADLAAGSIPTYSLEKRYIRKDCSLVWINMTIAAVRDATGRPLYYVSVIEDISSRKTAQDALRELTATLETRVTERTAQLAEANAELEAFGYSVSHDLRAPLRAMAGFATALEEDYGDRLDETGRMYAQRVVAAAGRMDTLIQDLLAYSRLSRAELQPQHVELGSIVADALRLLERETTERNARVTIEGVLPAVRGHQPTLAQVVANLLGNAIKFVTPGVEPRVRIWAEARQRATGAPLVRLVVADNGIGIEPEHQERIFRVFERLHGTEAYPGTGIGLAIVRKGIERMGGEVGVQSRAGEGSEFWIELPGVAGDSAGESAGGRA